MSEFSRDLADRAATRVGLPKLWSFSWIAGSSTGSLSAGLRTTALTLSPYLLRAGGRRSQCSRRYEVAQRYGLSAAGPSARTSQVRWLSRTVRLFSDSALMCSET
jgi:hypothetical protein